MTGESGDQQSHDNAERRAGWPSALMAARGHLGIIQSKKGLQVGHQVGVDAFQRLQQRNPRQLCKRLLHL